jgi:predicted naringenin-chalcone synthase
MQLSPQVATRPDAAASASHADQRDAMARAQIVGIGTANSGQCYSQRAILDLFRVEDRRVRSVFLNGGIETRYLTLPGFSPDGVPLDESQGELLAKHRRQGIEMGVNAMRACLGRMDADVEDVRYLCCVTTTGLLTPGLSALISRELDLPRQCGRLDVVGMGCNAGLNGLAAVNNWARANPGQLAVLLCVEVCSAAYIFDDSIETAVVNSLFGDGAAAVALMAAPHAPRSGPMLLKFASRLITESIGAMRFDWDDDHGKFNFYLDRDVPYVIGSHAELVIDGLLKGTGLRRNDISHWIVHSGGKKVIDAIRLNLGLTKHDLRHTTEILANYGNLSSGSFLFSYQRLLDEGVVVPGEYTVLMTMGPGTTIELALMQW